MYRLTLSVADRQAIDWVGHRYSHGDDFYKQLQQCDTIPDDIDWCGEGDITYLIPESLAWEMADSETGTLTQDGLACFSGELASKILTFLNKVV